MCRLEPLRAAAARLFQIGDVRLALGDREHDVVGPSGIIGDLRFATTYDVMHGKFAIRMQEGTGDDATVHAGIEIADALDMLADGDALRHDVSPIGLFRPWKDYST